MEEEEIVLEYETDNEVLLEVLEEEIKEVFPELEDLEVTPSGIEQTYKSKMYGYNEVKVHAVENEELTIVPSTEEQVKEGLYGKVTVLGDSNLVPENIAENKEIFGVKGAMIAGWDTSQIRNCNQMFQNNTEMIEAPYFGTSKVTSMYEMFNDCTNLTTVPQFDTSKVTTMYFMFSGCANLTTVPQFNTSNVTTMYSMFSRCTNLTTVPQFNTSNVTNMSYMFNGCTNLTTVPQFDTSKVTNMSSMFSDCTNLTTVPQFDTSKVTNMSLIFYNCTNLTTVPQFNTSKVTTMSSMFYNCTNLTTVPQFNTSNVTNMPYMFWGCTNLTDFGGVKDLGKAYTGKTSNYSSYKLDLSYCTKLPHESLMNVINNLYDLNLTYDVVNGGTLYTQSLDLGGTLLAKLTEEEIAIATNKGWNVS